MFIVQWHDWLQMWLDIGYYHASKKQTYDEKLAYALEIKHRLMRLRDTPVVYPKPL